MIDNQKDKETENRDTLHKENDQVKEKQDRKTEELTFNSEDISKITSIDSDRLKQVVEIQESSESNGSEEDTESEKLFTYMFQTCVRICLILSVSFKWNPP